MAYPRAAMEVTDDLSIPLPPGKTPRDVVTLVRDWAGSQRDLFLRLTVEFAMSADDARLAIDRVGGGFTRAATGNVMNRPDPAQDPIAFAAYRVALGQPDEAPEATSPEWDSLLTAIRPPSSGFALPPSFKAGARPDEVEAASAFEAAQQGHSTTLGSVAAIVRLEQLLKALSVTTAGFGPALTTLGMSISEIGERHIDELPRGTGASPGSEAWFAGVLLGNAALTLYDLLVKVGDERAGAAVGLHGRVVTSLLGHCMERVGMAMLRSARHSLAEGDGERAADFCDAIVADFGCALADVEDDPTDPLEEDVIAVECLLEALEIIREVRGASAIDEALLRRCESALGER